MQNNKLFKCYGVTSRDEVKILCRVVSEVLAMGANKEHLYLQLLEIAQAESKCGTIAYDPNRTYGLGIWQFDRVAFDDIKARIDKNAKFKSLATLLLQYSPTSKNYTDLKESPLLACVYARAYLYFKVPEKVGETAEKRAYQWKKYYNTYLGKGTEIGYLEKIKELA